MLMSGGVVASAVHLMKMRVIIIEASGFGVVVSRVPKASKMSGDEEGERFVSDLAAAS